MHNRPSSSRQILRVKIFYLLFAGEFHHHNWKSNLFNNCKRKFERNWNGNQIFSSLSYQRSEKRNKGNETELDCKNNEVIFYWLYFKKFCRLFVEMSTTHLSAGSPRSMVRKARSWLVTTSRICHLIGWDHPGGSALRRGLFTKSQMEKI